MDSNPGKPKKDGSSKSKKKKDRSNRSEPSKDGEGLASAVDTLFPSFDAPPRRTSSRAEDGRKPAAFPQTDTLNQMEQDVLAKSRASAARQSGTVAGAGRVVQSRPMSSSMASGTARASGLNQLEADLMIKNRARSSGPATAVGALQGQDLSQRNIGARAARGGSQQGKEASASAGGRTSRSSLRNLEQGVAAKTQGSRTDTTSSGSPSRLQQMEDDVVAKTRSRSYVSDPTPLSNSMRADSTQRSSMSELEDEIVAKRRAQPSSLASSTSSASARGKAAAAASLGSPLGDLDESDFRDEYGDDDYFNQQKKAAASQPDDRSGPDTRHDGFGDASPSTSAALDNDLRSEPSSQHQGSRTIQESAPASEAFSGDEEANGIEAFVPDQGVVDAFGVAVVMSDEEQERYEQRRSRRYMCFGILIFFALSAGIVSAVVLTVGKPMPAPIAMPTSVPSDIPSVAPSSAPTTTRLDAWLGALQQISSPEALTNRTSPQYRAAVWVSDEDELQLDVGSARGIQRYALAVFYFALGGDDWIQCGRTDPLCGGDIDDRAWLLGTENECDWLGVDCDLSNNVVDSIFFARQLGNGLNGNLPEEIVQLSELRAIIIQRDELKGTLPTFLGKLTKLQALFMFDCKLEGTIPTELLIGASLLGTIHFGENMLTGTIPTLVGNLPLQTLDLGENIFNGKIPSEIGRLSMLTYLELFDNRLTGAIPSELYLASSLTRIRLQNNSLSGSLDFQVGQLPGLEELRLGSNSLKGSIPSALYSLPSMVDFRCEDNQLTGQLSSSIGKLNNTLRRVYLANNRMTGPLPIAALESLSYLNELILNGNDFSGTISKALCDSKSQGLFFDLQNLTVSPRVRCDAVPGCCDLIN